MLVHQMVSHCPINFKKGHFIDSFADIHLHICTPKEEERCPGLLFSHVMFQLRLLIDCWT